MGLVFVACPVTRSFEYPTNSGIPHANEHRDVNEPVAVPGAILLSYTFHETVRRHADISFSSNEGGLLWTGKTKTNFQGESGNFGGDVTAMFAKVAQTLPSGDQALFSGFVNQDQGSFVD